MRILGSYTKNIMHYFTAAMAGILLFFALTGIFLERTPFNPDFHAELFKKYDIYAGTEYLIKTSILEMIEKLEKESPEIIESQKDLFMLLENNLTSELIAENLDSLRDGIFQYFDGDRRFLPDIYLTEPNSSNSISGISKINLGALLLYAERNDIIDYLSIIKFINYIITTFPSLFLLLLFLLFIIGLALFRKFTDIIQWCSISLSICAALLVFSGISLGVFYFINLPDYINPVTMTLGLKNEPILNYLQDLIYPVILFMLLTGLLFTAGSISGLRFSAKHSYFTVNQAKEHGAEKYSLYTLIMISLYIISIFILSSGIFYKASAIKNDFKVNDFYSVLHKMKGVEIVYEVTPAKDSKISDLQFKIVDGETEAPIPNIAINIKGKLKNKPDNEAENIEINETKAADEFGSAKFSLEEGSFRLTFDPNAFPEGYEIPAPYFFEIDSAGTSLVTIKLEPVPDEEPKWGIVEIEVLDDGNNPIEGLELGVLDNPIPQFEPDRVLSYTNEEGVAVFKLIEGIYKLNFTKDKFPKDLVPPENLEITVSKDLVTRYILKMVKGAP